MDFRRDSVVELASQVRAGGLSAREVVGHALSTIEALNPTINAFVSVDGDRAMDDALPRSIRPSPRDVTRDHLQVFLSP